MNIAEAHELGGTGLAYEFNHPLLGLDHLLDAPFLYGSIVLMAALIIGAKNLWKMKKIGSNKKTKTSRLQ